MIAMTVASDEDPTLKEWMAQFERSILSLLDDTLRRFDVHVTSQSLALFHATLVGVGCLNAGAASKASAQQARALVGAAFDRLLADGNLRVSA